MGQSLAQVFVHIIFSTKNRQPVLLEEYEPSLHAFIGARCSEMESPALAIGGGLDHIHIVCQLSKKISLMDLLKILKARPSGWIKTMDSRLSNFYWQDGYGVFSVSSDHLTNVIKYVQNQRNHHKKVSFKDEYLKLLIEHNIDFNEDYLWI